MTRYILRRRDASVTASLATPKRSMRPADREKQVEELISLRREEASRSQVAGWLGDTFKQKIAQVSAVLDATAPPGRRKTPARKRRAARTAPKLTLLPITGFSIANVPTGVSLTKLQAELPEYEVFEDRPISLIQPLPSAPTAIASSDNNWVFSLVGADAAKAKGLTGAGVTIAVLDTGVDESHPELQGKVLKAVEFAPPDGTPTAMAPSADTHYHGTHVAGIIAGRTVGVAPGARLCSAVMIPGGNGWTSDFIAAMEWAAADPTVQIVNMSAGLSGFHPEMIGATRDLVQVGILPVFAIGNEGRNTTRSPGNYDAPLSVGACDKGKQVASFSGGGSIVVDNLQYFVPDLVAPGVDVYSSVPGGQYRSLDGTSMATPVVAGVAALLLERHPNATTLDLIDAVLSTCTDLRYPQDRQGHGLVSFTGADGRLP
jgi:subtilisin family serine protease